MGRTLCPNRSTPRRSPRAWAKGLSQADPHVLHGVVVVHPGIPLALHGEVKGTMAGKPGQHVVQKAHAGLNLILPRAVQVQLKGNLCLPGLPGNLALPHQRPSSRRMSLTTVRKVSICLLRADGHPVILCNGRSEKCRIRMPCSPALLIQPGPVYPGWVTNRKLAWESGRRKPISQLGPGGLVRVAMIRRALARK